MVGGNFNANLGTYEATEELDVQITYSSTYTSPSNGTVYNNDFQLNLYDWNMTLINTSSSNNPGFVHFWNDGDTRQLLWILCSGNQKPRVMVIMTLSLVANYNKR